jgi:hypothetical protein
VVRSRSLKGSGSVEKPINLLQESQPLTAKQSPKATIELGRKSLKELVSFMAEEGIIHRKLNYEFKKNFVPSSIPDFVRKFTASQLEDFDFQRFPITVLDHRRLAELCVLLRPEKYSIGEIGTEDQKLDVFVRTMYDEPASEYTRVCNRVDDISKLIWWRELMLLNRG